MGLSAVCLVLVGLAVVVPSGGVPVPAPDSADLIPLPGPGLAHGGIPYGSISGNLNSYFGGAYQLPALGSYGSRAFGGNNETSVNNQAAKKIDVSDGKLKRQNEASGGRGEEVDLSTIPVSQPGAAGSPQQPGQSPFFAGGNPFLQQPYFGNGINFPGVQQSGFPSSQQPGFPGQQSGFPGQQSGFPSQQAGFPGGFANSFPSQGFPQGYPQFGFPSTGAGRNVILQNNGKQYLVQELNEQQRVVQKNGKQYLLQPYSGSNPVTGGLQTFNVPNSALAGLTPQFASSGALGSLGALSSLSGASDGAGGFPPNTFSRTSAPQRVYVNSGGQQLQLDQLPIRSGASGYLSPAIGAISAQLAQQGQQYASQSLPFGLPNGLSQAYSRANDAGYGLYATGAESGQSPLAKRNVFATSKEERNKSRH